jgi:hypothetical protein
LVTFKPFTASKRLRTAEAAQCADAVENRNAHGRALIGREHSAVVSQRTLSPGLAGAASQRGAPLVDRDCM